MAQRQTLSSYVRRSWYKHCRIVLFRWLWLREANSISCDAEYETERQTLSSCVVLNTTERQIAMEMCEVMMRGVLKCSKHEWRLKGEGRGMSVGFCTDFGFFPVGSCSAGGILSCRLLPPYPAKYIKMKNCLIFYLAMNPNLFPLGHSFTEVFQSVHD